MSTLIVRTKLTSPQLVLQIIEVLIGFAIGYIPCRFSSLSALPRVANFFTDIDNFAHIGGVGSHLSLWTTALLTAMAHSS